MEDVVSITHIIRFRQHVLGEPLGEPPLELTCRSEERQSFSKVGGEILLATSGCFCLDQGEQKPWRV